VPALAKVPGLPGKHVETGRHTGIGGLDTIIHPYDAVLRVNAATERLFCYPRDELLGRDHRMLLAEGFRLIGAPLPQPASPLVANPDRPALFTQLGNGWIAEYDGRQVLLPDLKGFGDIQRLLARSGEEIHCLDLAERVPSEHGGDEVLDDKARAAIKARLRDLQNEIAEAEDHNDIGRTERLRAEFDMLVETLSRALGLGGRSRRLGSLAERARTTVTWRIRHAVRRIEAAHPDLGRHFAHSLRTGTFCSYSPEHAVAWRLVPEPVASPAPQGFLRHPRRLI